MRDPKKFEEYTMKKVQKDAHTHSIFFNTVDKVDRKK